MTIGSRDMGFVTFLSCPDNFRGVFGQLTMTQNMPSGFSDFHRVIESVSEEEMNLNGSGHGR